MSITDYIYQFLRAVSIVMEFMLPYMKYMLFLILILGFLWVNRVFVTNTELRPLLIQSFQDERGIISGKAISAFVLIISIVIGWFIEILYSPNHKADEHYFWGICGLITSLYGIKEVGKVMTNKYSSSSLLSSENSDNEQQSVNISYDDLTLTEWKVSGSELAFSVWYKQFKGAKKSDPII